MKENKNTSCEHGKLKPEPMRRRAACNTIPNRVAGLYRLAANNASNRSLARNSSTYPLSSVSSHSVGGARAGLGLRFGVSPHRDNERRKSTGDEKQIPHQLNMFVRTRTDSGKQLSDMVSLQTSIQTESLLGFMK